MGRGGFDEHPRPSEAGPSCEGWPPLPSPAPLAGHKCTVVSSQLPKKTPSKVVWQLQVQHHLSQQDLQPAPAHVYLPSAPMGALRSFETTKKSLALGSDEWECLNREVRAGEALYTQHGGIAGTSRAVLQQPAQPSGNDEPKVPQIQEDELCLRNAGVNLWDQAQVQNVKHFMEREQNRQRQQQPTLTEAVDRLTSLIAGQPPPPDAVQPQSMQPPPPADPAEGNRMDMGAPEMETSQGDVAMGDGDGAHAADDTESAGTTKET